MIAPGLTRLIDPQQRTAGASCPANSSEPVADANPLIRQLLQAREAVKESPKWQHA